MSDHEISKYGILTKSLDETIEIVQNYVIQTIPSSKEFVTPKLLSRPPFHFLHTIIAHFCVPSSYETRYKFAPNVFTKEELNWHRLVENGSKADKIRFLIKILAYVSYVSGHRVDMYVSPAKVLCGQDVQFTLWFLFLLCKISDNTGDSELHAKAAEYVVSIGSKALYQKMVRTRHTITVIQARVRGFIFRSHLFKNLSKRNGSDRCDRRSSKLANTNEISACRIDDSVTILLQVEKNESLNLTQIEYQEPNNSNKSLNQNSSSDEKIQRELLQRKACNNNSQNCHSQARSNLTKLLPPFGFDLHSTREINQYSIDTSRHNNQCIVVERTKIKDRMKHLKKVEEDLRERQLLITLKETKLLKLADSLRRQQVKLIANHKKEVDTSINSTISLSQHGTGTRSQEQNDAIINSSKIIAVTEIRKKMKILEEKFDRKEKELDAKECRISHLAENVKKQHERLTTKQKKLDLIEASLTLRSIMKKPCTSATEMDKKDYIKSLKTSSKHIETGSHTESSSMPSTFKLHNPSLKKKKEKRMNKKRKTHKKKSNKSSVSSKIETGQSIEFSMKDNKRCKVSTAFNAGKDQIIKESPNQAKSSSRTNFSEQVKNQTSKKRPSNECVCKQEQPSNISDTMSSKLSRRISIESKTKDHQRPSKNLMSSSFMGGGNKLKTEDKTNQDRKSVTRMSRRQSTKTATASQASAMYQTYRFSFDRSEGNIEKVRNSLIVTEQMGKETGEKTSTTCTYQERNNLEWNQSFHEKLKHALRFCPIVLNRGTTHY